MKRLILTGILVLATGFSGLMAQKNKKGKTDDAQTAQQPSGPRVKSQAEAQAVQALGQAQDADTVIKAAEDLLTRFADTDFKDVALLMEARAYQAKKDDAKAQIFAERALEANPKSYQTTMLLGELLAAHIGEHDFDRDDKLTRAEKYLNDSIAAVTAAAKPNASLPDAQWEEIKKAAIAEGHNALGVLALDRKNYDAAIKEFQTAIASDPQGAYMVRLASSEVQAGKLDDAIALCDKLMADQQNPTQVRQVAQAVRSQALTKKNAGAPAAAAPSAAAPKQ
jgi:tetratricopeptide (TPR) repeat protein